MLRPSDTRTSLRSLLLVAITWGGFTAQAQELEFSATPAPVGAGARAAGMADAFTAVADDATAASWNPAGLVQLERPEIAVSGDWLRTEDQLDWSGRSGAENRFSDAAGRLNFLSFTYPFPRLLLGRRVVGSLSYQRRFDFSRELALDLRTRNSSPAGQLIRTRNRLEFKQDGALATMSAALAVELSPDWSAGVAVNFWRDTPFSDNRWTQSIDASTWTRFGAGELHQRAVMRTRYDNVTGENVTLGILWEPGPRWRVGLRYESAVKLRADYRAITLRRQNIFPGVGLPVLSAASPPELTAERRTIRLPDSWAAGVAFRATPRLTVAMDAVRQDWDGFHVKTRDGRRYSLVDGSDISSRFTRPRIDPTWTVRAGAEYVFLPRSREDTLRRLWSLRAGAFYEEEPATGRDSARNLFDRGTGSPDVFYGLALGVGCQVNRWLNADLGYQLRWGDNVNRDFVRNVAGFKEDVMQHRLVVSTVIYF